MSADRPLPPVKAIDLAAQMLATRGFAIVARNGRGDSLYLRRPESGWHLRLSNHARTAKQRARRSDILASLVIAGPRSPAQVEALVREAVRNFEAALAAVGDQASASGSRK